MWHDSEVAAIAYAVQQILERRRQQNLPGISSPTLTPAVSAPVVSQGLQTMAGKKCHECGAHAVIRKDGCEYCTACGAVGACG
jgi:ribonucleoside-diphosphate reductase alpha chain